MTPEEAIALGIPPQNAEEPEVFVQHPAEAPGSPLIPEAQASPSQLLAPAAEYVPRYGEGDMYKPRRMLWAGLMQDLAGQFSGWNGSTMGAPSGAAHTFHERALNANRQMRQANRQGAEEHRTRHNAHALQQLQFAEQQRLGAASQARQDMGIDPVLGQDHMDWRAAGAPGTFEAWLTKRGIGSARDGRTANQKDFATYQHLLKTDPNSAATFLSNFIRKERDRIIAGVTQGTGINAGRTLDPSTGLWVETTPENLRRIQELTGRGEGVAAASKTDTENWVQRTDAVKLAALKLPEITARADELEALAGQLESGAFGQNTGPLMGRLATYNDPDVARLNMMGVQNLLETIKGAGMGPISELEFKSLLAIFADPHSQPKVNAAKLRQAAAKLRKNATGINTQLQYINSNGGTLQGYGQPQRRPQQQPPQQQQQQQQPQQGMAPTNTLPPALQLDPSQVRAPARATSGSGWVIED